MFTKWLKFRVSILRKLNTRIINYLQNMPPPGATIQVIMTAKCTVIFLLQHLGFIIIFKNSLLTATRNIEFLGLLIDLVKLTFYCKLGYIMYIYYIYNLYIYV